jgi:hypothetical protein
VKTENRIECVTVNCEVRKSAIALQLPVVLSAVDKVSINPVIQSKTGIIVHATTLNRDSMYCLLVSFVI